MRFSSDKQRKAVMAKLMFLRKQSKREYKKLERDDSSDDAFEESFYEKGKADAYGEAIKLVKSCGQQRMEKRGVTFKKKVRPGIDRPFTEQEEREYFKDDPEYEGDDT